MPEKKKHLLCEMEGKETFGISLFLFAKEVFIGLTSYKEWRMILNGRSPSSQMRDDRHRMQGEKAG